MSAALGRSLDPVKAVGDVLRDVLKPTDALAYATDPVRALDYVLRRHADAVELMAVGLGRLRYVRVYTDEGKVVVGGVVCSGTACALAYILAKWW